MKILFLVVLVAAVNTGLFAADLPVRIMASSKLIIIEKDQWKAPSIEITISEANGNVLVHENIKKSTRYNLKHVPDGNYILEIEDNQKVKIQQLAIQQGSLLSEGVSTIYKPVIRTQDGKLDLNLMAQGQDAVITIRNSDNRATFTEHIKNEVSVTRRFNLEELEPGEYYIDVAISGKTFTRLISKSSNAILL
ncbi:MAG: T9SS type A sorting domain-containing protein [Saprospiraceae bacterium]|nr:T9SS type A sorting domain-containing protein [Saprospiraceae bacterium]